MNDPANNGQPSKIILSLKGPKHVTDPLMSMMQFIMDTVDKVEKRLEKLETSVSKIREEVMFNTTSGDVLKSLNVSVNKMREDQFMKFMDVDTKLTDLRDAADLSSYLREAVDTKLTDLRDAVDTKLRHLQDDVTYLKNFQKQGSKVHHLNKRKGDHPVIYNIDDEEPESRRSSNVSNTSTLENVARVATLSQFPGSQHQMYNQGSSQQYYTAQQVQGSSQQYNIGANQINPIQDRTMGPNSMVKGPLNKSMPTKNNFYSEDPTYRTQGRLSSTNKKYKTSFGVTGRVTKTVQIYRPREEHNIDYSGPGVLISMLENPYNQCVAFENGDSLDKIRDKIQKKVDATLHEEAQKRGGIPRIHFLSKNRRNVCKLSDKDFMGSFGRTLWNSKTDIVIGVEWVEPIIPNEQ